MNVKLILNRMYAWVELCFRQWRSRTSPLQRKICLAGTQLAGGRVYDFLTLCVVQRKFTRVTFRRISECITGTSHGQRNLEFTLRTV